MQKSMRLVLVMISLLLVLTGCESNLRPIQMTPADKQYVFTIQDIGPLPVRLSVVPFEKGGDYLFTKTLENADSLGCLYGINLKKDNGNPVTLQTSISISDETDRAQALYDKNRDTLRWAAEKMDMKLTAADLTAYQADEGTVLNQGDQCHVILRKGRLVYQVNIDGITVNEAQFRAKLAEKMDYIIGSGVDGKRP